MHTVTAWSGLRGRLAGPLFQAAVELDEQVARRRGASRVVRQAERPRHSPWWWLWPPVAYVLQAGRQREVRQRLFEALSPEEPGCLVELTSVATGWSLVTAGACFVAVTETYEVAELYEWPLGVFPALLVVMLAACAAHTVLRVRRAHRLLEATAAGRTAEPALGPS